MSCPKICPIGFSGSKYTVHYCTYVDECNKTIMRPGKFEQVKMKCFDIFGSGDFLEYTCSNSYMHECC